jgi:Card1-like endonuclease family protein
MPFLIHFCLAFDPVIANITPILDTRFRPEEVILLVCPERQQQAKWLQDALESLRIKVSLCEFREPLDVAHIRNKIQVCLDSHPKKTEIALNITGGTRLMSIAAYDVFKENNNPIFYIDPSSDQIIWVHNPQNFPQVDLKDKIQLPAFLLTHGVTLKSDAGPTPISGNTRSVTAELIRQIEKYSAPLSFLNGLASSAEHRLYTNYNPALFKGENDCLQQLVELFKRFNLIKVLNGTMTFTSEAARFFVNGGWLEEHTYNCVCKLRDELKKDLTGEELIQDLRRSMCVEKMQKEQVIKNELDVAFLADNKLHIIECKTKRLDRDAGPHADGAEVLYKLDTLRDHIGGLQAHAMLVSYKPLKKEHLWRATDLGIEVCQGKDIQNLPQRLGEWIATND